MAQTRQSLFISDASYPTSANYGPLTATGAKLTRIRFSGLFIPQPYSIAGGEVGDQPVFYGFLAGLQHVDQGTSPKDITTPAGRNLTNFKVLKGVPYQYSDALSPANASGYIILGAIPLDLEWRGQLPILDSSGYDVYFSQAQSVSNGPLTGVIGLLDVWWS